MVADAMTLSDDRRAAGVDLLKLVDGVDFDAVGAGWGYAEATEIWRFFLFTEMVDDKGPLWVWERLLKAFHKLSLPNGMTPLDIVVASPHEWLYRSTSLKVGGDIPPGLAIVVGRADLTGSDYGIDRLWLLRAKPEAALRRRAETRSRRSAARLFDLKVRQLVAA